MFVAAGFSLVASALAPAALASGQPAQEDTPVEIPARVQRQIDSTGEATFWIRLDGKADLRAAAGITDWAERGRFVYETLTAFADSSQAAVRSRLDAAGAEYRPFWISNTIRVTGDARVLSTMAAHPDVTAIEAPKTYALPDPRPSKGEIQTTEWGLDAINAPDVWADFGVRGEGIVVANIDSGVQFDHPALAGQYRGTDANGDVDHNYNWVDPSAVCGSDEPCDNNGHGTHTMGTMVGDDGAGNQIGVAPAARWIAAKGCETNNCSDFALLESGEWVVAPTDLDGQNPRPDLRPHIVNNSWGGGVGDDWYMDTVDAWIAAGIFPMFANGNAGSSCGSVSTPGDYPQSYGVGAFDINGNIAGFSGRGPSAFGGIVKPNVSAPGVNVRSSVPTDSYANFDGTSMATPHTSGAVALMWSAAPALVGNIDETRAIIDQTAIDTEDLTCGGQPGNNNVWGEGKLDALAAVEQSPRGETATLTGTVTDAVTGEPIVGATVAAAGEIDRTGLTDENGGYELLLIAGSFEVTVEAYGYAAETTSVDLTAGETTTLDFALDALPTTVVSGTVTDGSGHGWPLYARLDIDGYPQGPVFTDPETGEYSVELVESTDFTFNVSAVSGGYVTESRPVTVPPDSTTQDFSLLVDTRGCTAPGYGGTGCAPEAGGLVVGNVSDLQTGEPLDDATVTVDEELDATTETVATPEDDNLDDGFYLLFSPLTGPTDITADKSLYAPTTETVDVVADGVVRQDFQLGSGQLEVDPDALEAEVALGESADLALTLSNVGTGAAEFEIRERNRGRDILNRGSGADLAAPGDVEFSPRVKGGPASALSADARAAVGGRTAAPASPDWQTGAPVPAGLVRYAFATCEDDPEVFYVISGVSNGNVVTTTYRYDAAADTWTTLAPIPTGQEGPNAACFEGRIYTVGGGGSNQHFVYDVAANTWSAAAPVPQGAAMASMGAFDGKVVYAGGDSDFSPGTGVFDEVYIYDIASNSWSPGSPMPTATSGAGTAQAGEFLYVVGGWGAGAPGSNVNLTQRYDMTADTWEAGPEFTPAKADLAVAASGDALYAIAGDNNSGGFFDATASVHRLDVSAWPSGSWEDIADPLPSPRTANQAGFCSTAKAGGEIYSVGGFANFVWNSETLYRVTGEGCAGGVDVPWVSADPVTGTIEAGASIDVAVTVDALVPEVDQPGAYRAELAVAEDTPHRVPPVPVTMNVTPPADWGKATGTVTGLAECDGPGAPLDGATVQIGDFTVETDDTGLYEWWLAEGTYPITVSADGYVTQTGEVVITAGDTTETSFDLRLDAPCPTVSPDRFEFTVPFGGTDGGELTIDNSGAGAYDFRIRERDRGRDIAAQGPAAELAAPGDVEFSPRGATGPASALSPAAKKAGVDAAGAAAAAPAAPDWQAGAPAPAGIIRYAFATCAESPEVFYVISGVSNGTIVNTNYRYDAAADTWTTLAPIPTGQEGPNAACFEGRIYVIGGGGSNQHFVYDIAANTWSAAAPVPRGAAMASAGAFDGKVFYIGGDNDFSPGTGVFNEVFIYDIASNTWSQGSPMPAATSGAGTVQGGEFLYVVGGWGAGAPGSNVNLTQRYDMSADTWETGPQFTIAKADLALAASGAALYAIGGDNNAAGFFDASTSVHRLDLGDWPGGAWEDLGDPLPSPRSANQAGFCTTAKSGGEIYSVGGFAGFVWTNANVYRETGEGCAGASDVPWLTVDPTEGTVEPGGSTTAAVAIDASVPEVDQPGAYAADLVLSGPGADAIAVPVTMNVTVPDDFGKATGTVVGLARCDRPGAPLDGATVQIGDFTVETDDTGLYEWWLAEGTYPITVSADGHVTQTGEVVISAGDITETSFDLRLDAPCATASPEAIELTVPSGESGDAELTFGNLGPAGYSFEIFETPFDVAGTSAAERSAAAAEFSAPAEVGALSVRSIEARGRAGRSQIQAPPWFGGADIPEGLVRYGHAQCDGDSTSFFVVSGVNDDFAVDSSTWRFDADSNSWTELAAIPTGQEGPSAVCTGGKLYVMGGGGTNQHFIYNIATNTWSAGAPVPRSVWGAAIGAFAGKVYLIGGDSDFTAGGTSSAVDVYDIATDTWSSGSPMPTAAVTPGDAVVSQFVYVAGGWGDASPGANLDVTQRYDMLTDTWTTGPPIESARADLALAATGTAIYAAGGDNDGGGFFDATATAERLDVTGWPDGAWAGIDSLPLAVTSNNAGFCTEEIFGTEVWNVGGANPSTFGITGRTFFRRADGEACATIRADVPWLSVEPTMGDVAGDSSTTVTVSVDATGLEDGEYTATLIVETTDPHAAELLVPVRLTVAGEPPPRPAAWVALEANGRIGGVPVTRSDVALVMTDGSVDMAFDGSAAGLPGRAHLDAVALAGEAYLMSFTDPVNVPGLGQVDDSDIVVYDGSAYDLWLDGSDVGLSTNNEDVDALDVLDDGTIVVSVLGQGQVPGVSMRGEDLIALDTEDEWSMYFDGSDVGLSTSQELVDAAAIDGAGSLDLSTTGRLSAGGYTADDDDVAVFEPTELGEDTAGSFTSLLVDGSPLGIATNDIVAVEVPS